MPADPYGTRADGLGPPLGGPYETRAGGPGPAPSGDLPTSILGDLRPVPPPGGPWPPAPPGARRRSRRPLIAAIAGAALVAVVIGFLAFRTHPAKTAASGGKPAGTTPSASSQAGRRQAAAGLSGLLAHSVTDRAAVINAVADVRACGPSLQQDARVFASAAGSRQRLLSRLGGLPGRALLPASMLQSLTGAWQASAQVDTDLAQWADDKIAHGCHRNGSDASLRASYGPDGQATADKQAFASLWDPVARQYGLTVYQWNQL